MDTKIPNYGVSMVTARDDGWIAKGSRWQKVGIGQGETPVEPLKETARGSETAFWSSQSQGAISGRSTVVWAGCLTASGRGPLSAAHAVDQQAPAQSSCPPN